MRYIHPDRWPPALAAYLCLGFVLGLGWVQDLAGRAWGRPGLGTAIAVNLLMPLVAMGVSVVYPRARTAAAGGVLITVGWVLARMVWVDWMFWRWNLALLARMTHPLLVPATMGYIVIGIGAAYAVQPWRRVGLADAGLRCAGCGYLLTGIEEARCPECGLEFDPWDIA